MPVTVTDLVADQCIARGVIRDAQQRLSHTHQGHPFLTGERELLHQCLDAAAVLVAAQAFNQSGGNLLNGSAL